LPPFPESEIPTQLIDYCKKPVQIWKEDLPKLIGPDRHTVEHTTNVINSFDGRFHSRPNYLKNIDIVGTNSGATDVSATDDYYKNLIKILKGTDKEVWCTNCAQEFERIAPIRENIAYQWAPEERRLRSERNLKSIRDTNINQYWRAYLKDPPTTTPLSLAINGGVSAYVVWNAIPRVVNAAGDPAFLVDWYTEDRVVDTNNFRSTFDMEPSMVDRNWETPYQVREYISFRRTEKPCPRKEGSVVQFTLPGYDTCVMRFHQADIDQAYGAPDNVEIYIDHRSDIHSWIETCQNQKGGACEWTTINQGRDQTVKGYDSTVINTYLFESDVPYDSDFTVKIDLRPAAVVAAEKEAEAAREAAL
jgi:hypothetical protein